MKNEKLKKLLKSWDKSLNPKFKDDKIAKEEILEKIRVRSRKSKSS